MKSWRTSLSGIATILASIGGAMKLFAAGQTTEAVTVLITGIPTGIGLIKARDNKVTSEQAGAGQKQP
jgi:hypothetical protein